MKTFQSICDVTLVATGTETPMQELKAFKLEQKDQARNLKQFQRNVTAVLGQLAFEVDLLATRLNRLDPPVPAILPPENESGGPSLVSGSDSLNCSADEILDFREKVLRLSGNPRPAQICRFCIHMLLCLYQRDVTSCLITAIASS